ncbi:hypothetical protein ABK040_009118 [Willaertia magna]
MTEFTEIKRITDTQQIKERREKEQKEQERLLNFELKFQLLPFSCYGIDDSYQIQIIVKEYDVQKEKFVTIGITEALPQYNKNELKNEHERILLGDYKFNKPISRKLNFGIMQRLKLFVRFLNHEDAQKHQSIRISRLEDIDEVDETNDKGIVCVSEEFHISELLMNTERKRIVKFIDMCHNHKINYEKSDLLVEEEKLPKAICYLITPLPREHVIPRITTESGNHIILKDISEFGEVEAKRMSITMRLQIRNAPEIDKLFLKVNPYFVVFKDGAKFKERLYTSEIIKNTKNATYRVFSFGLEGERSLEKPMLIEWWSHNPLGRNHFLGIVRTDILDLREGKAEFNIVDPDTPNAFRGTMHILKYEERIWLIEDVTQKLKSKKTGKIKNVSYRIYKNDFSLLNYLGYYELRLVLGIDFTASNGIQPLVNKKSLHYIGSTKEERKSTKPLNPYEVTMCGLMKAIYQYGEQKEMKMYGFGALNANGVFEMQEKKRVSREAGILDEKTMLHTYRRSVKKVIFGLDNNFVKIIQQVASFAERLAHYFVCAILIDGDEGIDKKTTLNILKQSQLCGVSFVFIGIGNKSLFKNLQAFQMECRNVTFVRYQEHQELNALQALKHVPQQIREYYAQRKIVPEEY